MEQLVAKMDTLLASTFVLYLKAHKFHWNVEGQDFPQYHTFFGNFYEEVYDSVDATAEQIRALGSKSKGSLTEFKDLSVIRDQITDLDIRGMTETLYRDNEALIAVLMEVHSEAEKQKQFGLVNYIEGRIDTHRKHGWMLRASIKPTGSTNEQQSRTYEINFNK